MKMTSTANIVRFTGITTLDLDPDAVLKEAIGKLEGVIVIGYDKDEEEYFASSYADGGDTLWLIERFKKMLMEVPDETSGSDPLQEA